MLHVGSWSTPHRFSRTLTHYHRAGHTARKRGWTGYILCQPHACIAGALHLNGCPRLANQPFQLVLGDMFPCGFS